MLEVECRMGFAPEHDLFREQVRKFFDRELIPNLDRWDEEGVVDRPFWIAAGSAGLRIGLIA